MEGEESPEALPSAETLMAVTGRVHVYALTCTQATAQALERRTTGESQLSPSIMWASKIKVNHQAC